ncbi:hypothetical protein DMO16_12815 [Fictibacillus sp. S7]|nr:hypothetical protein DMO16_12815 [Fictibacillus sp. S7]
MLDRNKVKKQEELATPIYDSKSQLYGKMHYALLSHILEGLQWVRTFTVPRHAMIQEMDLVVHVSV